MPSSIQPRKQRKARFSAPAHKRAVMMHVHLSKELRSRLGTNRCAISPRKGDKVRLRRGDDYTKTGNIMEVDCKHMVIYVEGITRKNAKGVDKLRALQPGSLEIMDGDFGRKDRAEMLNRSKNKLKMQPKTQGENAAPAQSAQNPAPASASQTSGQQSKPATAATASPQAVKQ